MKRSMKDILLIFALCITLMITAVPVSGSDEARGEPWPPMTDFHNAYVYLNLTYGNGTPAEGFDVEYKNKRSGSIMSKLTNLSGQAKFTVHGLDWGVGTIKFKEGSLYQGYEEFFIGPDQSVYLDLVVGDVPAHVNTITGILRNRTSGEPVSGMEVKVLGADIYGNSYSESAISDELGSYEIMVPNSTRTFRLDVYSTGGEGFFDHYGFALINDPPEVVDHDIDLLPTYITGSTFRFKAYNSTTDQVMPDGNLNLVGYTSDYDFSYGFMGNIPRVGDWFQRELPIGEYEFSWTLPKDLDWNVTFSATGDFLMNDTPLDLEMGVAVPEFVDLNLEVWNSTNPLNYAYLRYSKFLKTPQGTIKIYSYVNSDINGKLHVGIPIGVETEVTIHRGGHIPQYITLDPTGTMDLNITLEEFISEVVIPPLADVTIVVKDRETGTPLPRATINGNGQYGDSYVSLGFGKTTNDYGVFTGQISQGEYEYFFADHNLGHGRLDTVTIGPSNPEIVIMVDRFDVYGDMEEYHFTVKDSSGMPAPDVWVKIYPLVMYPGPASYVVESDPSGVVRFYAYPGIPHRFSTDDNSVNDYRPMWSSGSTDVTTPETGGKMDDLIVHSSRHLNAVHGFVRDSTNMEVLPQVNVETSSFAPGTDPMFNPHIADYWDGIIHLYTQRFKGSNEDGYYRVRGRDTMFVLASADGYLPLLYRPEMVTRADLQHDLLLDPIPEETFNISGTVIDQYGEPLDSGWLTVTDHDRGEAPLRKWADLSDGNEFSFEVWNGNFTLCFENRTLKDFLTLEATGDQEGIVFQIIPEFDIDGTVTDWEGTAVESLNVSLILHDEGETEIAWTLTDAEGYYAFEGLTMGDYTVRTGLTELYAPYETETIAASGWLDINIPIILENRSIADIFGQVLGEDGEYMGGIPGANVGLSQDGLHVVTTYADELGYFRFTNVSHGTNYSLKATPPAGLEPMAEIRSGYLENFTMNITVSGYEVELDLYLPYQVETPSDYLNITGVWPIPGAVDVPLDERIVITFSIGVEGSTIVHLINITPPLENMMYSWSGEGMTLTLECDDLMPNTTYEVAFPSTALSIDGYPLHPANVLVWNFTTGSTVATWKITGASVEFIGSVDLTVAVSGIEGTSIYFVVDGVGSFLIPADIGAYRSTIPISEFEWNTTYSYHFSSTDGGPDEAPAFSGTFTTPVNPAIPPGWDITEAVVTVDEDGDWTVEVTGEAGMDVFIVIDGWGSLKLEETEDGVYELTISGDEFNWEETYSYHFSDSSGGDDLAPSESGSQTIPHKPARSDDDEDNLTQIAAVCCLSLVIVLLAFVLIFVLISRRKRANKLDYEEE